jgi:hypothetical protein
VEARDGFLYWARCSCFGVLPLNRKSRFVLDRVLRSNYEQVQLADRGGFIVDRRSFGWDSMGAAKGALRYRKLHGVGFFL